MIRPSVCLLALAALIVGLAPAGADAQLLSPACNMNCTACPGCEQCALVDLPCHGRNTVRVTACTARQTACMGLLTGYNVYMGQMAAGQTTHALPSVYKDILRRHYTGGEVDRWRFAFSDRQPANNATTNCNTTFFNSHAYVDKLHQGQLASGDDFSWFLHEMRHVGQCAQVGGHDFYARMWFDHLILTAVNNPQAVQNVDFATLHDRMPMEGDASQVATRVLGALRSCCLDAAGKLVKPFEVTDLVAGQERIHPGDRVPITAQVTGGSDPKRFGWTVREPQATAFRPLAGSGEGTASPDSNVAEFAPRQGGAYQLRVAVSQPNSRLQVAERSETFTVTTTLQIPVTVREALPRATLPRDVLVAVTPPAGDLRAAALTLARPRAQLVVDLAAGRPGPAIGSVQVASTFGEPKRVDIQLALGASGQCRGNHVYATLAAREIRANGAETVELPAPTGVPPAVVAQIAGGQAWVCALVDPANRLAESNADNNCACAPLR